MNFTENAKEYNDFSISYIKCLEEHLENSLSSKSNFTSLKSSLKMIWGNANSAIQVVKQRHEAFLQMGLFGYVKDFEEALKVGFLLGDRIVLIDVIYKKLNSSGELKDFDKVFIDKIATSYAQLKPLVENGRIVILPNPIDRFKASKLVIDELSAKVILTPDLMSMLNMLSISKKLHIHPYTLANSEARFDKFMDEHINYVNQMGMDTGVAAYNSILGALLSEKLLHEEEFQLISEAPIEAYQEVISQEGEFYQEFLSALTFGGSLNAENNLNQIKSDLKLAVNKKNKLITKKIAKGLTIGGSISSGTIGLLGAIAVLSPPVAITGAALGLGATLTGLLEGNDSDENIIISVFQDLAKKGKSE